MTRSQHLPVGQSRLILEFLVRFSQTFSSRREDALRQFASALCAVVVLTLNTLGGIAMADDSPAVAALKEQAARANAERDLAKAQLEELQAKQKLADTKSGTDIATQAANAKAQAEAQTAIYSQQKAAADAQAAAVNAELAALKTKFGTVTGSSLTGAVTNDAGAGNGEASLLAAQAVDAAAKEIKAKLPAPPAGKRYVIFAGPQRPILGQWRAFRLQTELIERAFSAADEAKTIADNAADDISAKQVPAPGTAAGTESVAAAITGAGAILDLGSKLGSYFQSDYKVGPSTVSGSDDDLLAVSVAGALADAWFPARWMPQAGDEPVSALLKPLQSKRTASIGKLRDVQKASEKLSEAAEKEKDPGTNAALKDAVSLYGRAIDAFTTAQKRFDDMLTSLSTVDKDGVPLVSQIIDQRTLADSLRNGDYLLFLRLNASAGGYYTEKNLWTFFGGMPFYVSGGAIASYIAVDSATGAVKGAGQVQIHSGYHKMNSVEQRFLMPSVASK